MATDSIKLSPSPVSFSHPLVNKGRPLVIQTGMNEVSWPFILITNQQPTYDGMVIQILGVTVDAITLSGNTATKPDLRAIYNWFLSYMQVAGLADRNEEAVVMSYPERGWQFLIQPTDMPNFIYDVNQVVGEWTLTAEMVSDTDKTYFASKTMNDFTKGAFDPSLVNVGFDPENPAVNPLAAINHDDLDEISHNIGNNFQALLGAYSSGDFMHWAFDATTSTSSNKLKDSKEYWTEIFGSDFVRKGTAGTSTSSPFAGPANPVGDVAIAGLINNAFEQHGVPGFAGVASAMQESGLDANRLQYGPITTENVGVGLFQATPPKAPTTNANFKARQVLQAAVSAGVTSMSPGQDWAPHVVAIYSEVAQAEDAAQWWSARLQGRDLSSMSAGEMAQIAQGAGDPNYISKVNANVAKAKQLIKQAKAAGQFGPQALAYAVTQIGQGENPPGSNNTPYGAWYGLNGQPWCIMFLSYCFNKAGSSFHYAAANNVAADAKANRNGLSVTPNPVPGTVAIFGTKNGDNEYHGGFFQSWINPGHTFWCVSGNWNNQVSRTQFDVSQVGVFVNVNS